MQYRSFGSTGFAASILGLGGESALYRHSEAAVQIIVRALELGVNYFDTAPLYQDSELNYGEVTPYYRDRMFLATKTDQRDRDSAWRQFENSLRRLRTDHVDLLQIHHLDRHDEVDQVLGPSGAVTMAEEARAQGLARHVGISGHSDPEVLLRALAGHRFDSILLAMNPADVHRLSFQSHLLPYAVRTGVGIVCMKVFARGEVFRSLSSAEDALGYVWSLPVDLAIVGIENVGQLERNAAIASAFSPLGPDRMAALEAACASDEERINYYRTGSRGDEIRQMLGARGPRNSGGAIY
ncbi:MAG TPA: aldo/keto reductase [Gaiellaceae bacterium]|nr:aldo/keto reductase [Gaiellaceae bacterium]